MYTKPKQYYIDQFDRQTIYQLKELEKRMFQEGRESPTAILGRLYISDAKTQLFEKKDSTISEWISRDQKKDEMVSKPPNISSKCHKCDENISLTTHMFINNDEVILFVYTCSNNHSPKRVFYPDSREYFFPKEFCKKCGGELKSSSKKYKDRLELIDLCLECGDKVVDILELKNKLNTDQIIDESERVKYCTINEQDKNLQRDIKSILDFGRIVDEKKKRESIVDLFDQANIIKITVPKLESKLKEITSKVDFVKFNFDSVDQGKNVVISFSVQDPTDRSENDSIKELKHIITTKLFKTNWRLMSDGITYRLGLLNGRLKAYETEEELLKIAKEISKIK